jgi:uncharacterized protein (DUF983 family)
MKHKCPHCGQKTIPIINRTFLAPRVVLNCPQCGQRYGMASYAMFVLMAIGFAMFLLMVMLLKPISEHFEEMMVFNALGMMGIYTIYLFLPYEKR